MADFDKKNDIHSSFTEIDNKFEKLSIDNKAENNFVNTTLNGPQGQVAEIFKSPSTDKNDVLTTLLNKLTSLTQTSYFAFEFGNQKLLFKVYPKTPNGPSVVVHDINYQRAVPSVVQEAGAIYTKKTIGSPEFLEHFHDTNKTSISREFLINELTPVAAVDDPIHIAFTKLDSVSFTKSLRIGLFETASAATVAQSAMLDATTSVGKKNQNQ